MLRMFALSTLVAVLALPAAALCAERIFSYDPADERTKAHVERGLTFVFDKNLLTFRVKEVLATQARATALVEPAGERELGARLDALLPAGAAERELYRVTGEKEGPAMVRALCPGSTKGWLVFGVLRPRRDVAVHALGDDPATGGARYCATLNLRYRGEWALPRRDPRIVTPSPFVGSPF